MPATKRRLSVGAEVSGDSQVAVRVWAPMHATVRLTSDDGSMGISFSGAVLLMAGEDARHACARPKISAGTIHHLPRESRSGGEIRRRATTPMLFQGQEIGSTTPWVFFADHHGELGDQVRKGRLEFLAQFPRLAEPMTNARIPDATSRATFDACKLTHERDPRAEPFWRLHRDLLALRRSDPSFSAQRRPEGVSLGPRALLLRFGDPAALSTRLLLVNLDSDAPLAARSEPLLAPRTAAGWRVLWSSEHPDYGGGGLPPWNEARWTLPAHAAVVLGAEDDGRARG